MRQEILKPSSLLKINRNKALPAKFIPFISIILFSFLIEENRDNMSKGINEYVKLSVIHIQSNLDSIEFYEQTNTNKAKTFYQEARKSFKQIEFYTEYHFPFHSKFYINGALVNKAEFEYGYKTFTPHGFQTIEAFLFDSASKKNFDIKHEIKLLKGSFDHVSSKSSNKRISSAQLVDMLRFEIIRIMSLYLNGFDSTFELNNINETTEILTGFKVFLSNSFSSDKLVEIKQEIEKANVYLGEHPSIEKFDRLEFITMHLKPLYEKLYTLYDTETSNESFRYAINIRSKSFYGKDWFNNNYFTTVIQDSLNHAKQAELGKILFFDPILSGNNKRACASCHNINNGFGGAKQFDLQYDKKNKLTRNTPSLMNVVFQKMFFYDGRARQVEEQANVVLTNHNEMFAEPTQLAEKLKMSIEYKTLFNQAFKNTEDSSITYYAILKSLNEFERTLVTLDSRFDKYLRGEKNQLSNEEIKGYNIFAGKALCATCHFFPLFNGLVPPFYSDNEFEVIGVPKTKSGKEIDADSGRFVISKNPISLHAFKTVSIRNIDKTAPYMHNGVFKTLDEVLDFYNKGGGAGLGIDVPNQTLPFDSLQLNKEELSQLKKFMLALTDKEFKVKTPSKLPVVSIKGLEKRKVGGEY